MKRKTYDILLLAIVALGVIASVANLSDRARFESTYRDVTIAVDYFQLHKFARYSGTDIDVLLGELKSRGINTIALLEDTPEFLEERGIASVAKGFNIEERMVEGPESRAKKEKSKISNVSEDKIVSSILGLSPNQVHVIFQKGYAHTLDLYSAWAFRFGENLVDFHELDSFDVISLTGDPEELYQAGAGFITELRDNLTEQSFDIIPRFRNNRRLSSDQIKAILASEPISDSVVIFEGDEILGFPSALSSTAEGLKSQNAIFGYVEFAKQDGDRSLGLRSLPKTVRVHSISDEEMKVYSTDRAVSRFVRAARERSTRVIYLKPFFHNRAGDDLLSRNLEYFERVKSELIESGFTPGSINEHKWQSGGHAIKLITLLAIISGLALLAGWGWNFRSWIILILLFVVTVLVSVKSAESIYIKIFGMIVGCSYPVLGMARLFQLKSFIEYKVCPLYAFILITVHTLIGALLVGSLFSTTSYMLEMSSYSGVKLTLLLPLFLAALIGVRLFFSGEKKGFLNELVFLGDMQIRVKHLFVLAVVGFAGLIILTRSGNEPIFAVSNFENIFRAMLEDFFAVRPRTKEFLIGHPLLMLALFAHAKFARKLESLVFICIVGGMVGQVSIFNTFCHFHTPLSISISRTGYGLIAGLIIGSILCGLLVIMVKWISGIAKK